MEISKNKVLAIGLSSGGLDSMLAALVLKQQGIEVLWVSFETPFFSADKAREASQMTGIPLRVEKILDEYMGILLDPPAGYGKNMNPCMDCHALMFRLAGKIMEEEEGSFLFSGEVLGQRPKSQTRNAMNYVAKHSGRGGYILRPLSAKSLEPTIPENQGWVDRERLLDFSGRTRKPQMALAREYGIKKYPAPAGGCLLTDKGFSDRLKDLIAHQGEYGDRDFELLKHGRHFRLDETGKAVVGRNKADNEQIEVLADSSEDIVISMANTPGPKVLVPHGAPAQTVHMAAALCAAYSKSENGADAMVNVIRDTKREVIRVETPDKEDFAQILL